jgi:hypothetical protein
MAKELDVSEVLQEIHSTLSLLIKVMAAGHNQIAAKLDLMIPSQMMKADFEQQRGVSAPVDTNPSRE